MSKVLITGATGFIGSHLLNKVMEKSGHVRILALPNDEKAKIYEKKGLDVIYGDISDSEIIEKALKGIEIVYHLAAVVSDWAPKELYKKVNIDGMENICESSLRKDVARFVYVSTNDVFGLWENTMIDESFPYRPWGEPYPDSKLEASRIAWKYFCRGLPVSMIYPCWVYGPGDTTFLLPVVDALRRNQLIYWRKNSLIWPTYISNVVDLLIEIATNPQAIGHGFLVHDGVSDTFRDFIAKIASQLELKNPKLHIPYLSAFIIASCMQIIWRMTGIKSRPLLTTYIVKNLGSRLRFSISKAQDTLNWKPNISYEEGLQKTIEWLKTI